MSAGPVRAVGEDVFFFLSYAHMARQPDKPVRDFFHDLSAEVARVAGLPSGTPVGFADWQIPTGHDWTWELGRVLSTCGTFVSLYTPRYFKSEFCGQEWAAFRRRESMHYALTREHKAAIVPVRWTRIVDGDIAPKARHVHYQLTAAGDLYDRRGMRELVMRRSRNDIGPGYQLALAAFAEHIVEVARTDPLIPKSDGILRLNPEDNAFAPEWRRGDLPPLRLVIVAPVTGEVPRGADPRFYEPTPDGWHPWPDSKVPIGKTAAALVELQGFQPIVESLESCLDLRDGASPSAPTVLIVDPWAAQVTPLRERLRAFDAISHEKPWIRLVVLWDRDGSPDGGQVQELEDGLGRALDQMRSHCRLRTPEAVAGLPTITAFGERLPGVIAAAEKGYFRRAAPPLPLEEGQPGLPRFGGTAPENGPSDGSTRRGRTE